MTHTGANPAGGDQTQSQAELLAARNDRLVDALTTARTQIVALKTQLDELARPPGTYAIFLAKVNSNTIDVLSTGRKMHVGTSPKIDVTALRPGQEVKLNEAMVAVAAGDFERIGEIATVKEILTDGRVLVVGRTDDERVLRLAGSLDCVQVRIGDQLTTDARSGFAYEVIPHSEVSELVLEEVPDIDYSDIGGLSAQIEQIRDAIELPLNHADLFREHGLRAPKGVLLYGPPGCGKTLIAKAVANSLARMIAKRDGADAGEIRSYFLNIKGPELLNKYVGETERHIRQIFGRAREKASQGAPVVVFFDEMESLFRTRGTGVSSDVETTIVPQLLAEIDGVERLDNVIVIGASNREDMIDPAILRPGRLDVKIKIERPDAAGAREIFSKYLTADLPINDDDLAEHQGDRAAAVTAMITQTVERVYATDEKNRFLEVTYASGDRETLFFKDFSSGAMIQNIVDRAKKFAIKDFLATGVRGVRTRHLLDACSAEFKENEDLPNTTNPDDWARVSGKKGERIVFIRTVIHDPKDAVHDSSRAVEDVATVGKYL